MEERGRGRNYGMEESLAADGEKRKKGFLENLALWIVVIIGFIPSLFGYLLEMFTEPGAPGTKTLGAIMFGAGAILSCDFYWQMFGMLSLFPFFETHWIGWGWFPGVDSIFPLHIHIGIIFNPLFWISLCFSTATQVLQACLFHSYAKSAVAAKVHLNPKAVGLIAMASLAFEICLSFNCRNPLRYDDPGMVVWCLLYNVFSIFSAECGRTIYKVMKG